jgi:hypothetical protein
MINDLSTRYAVRAGAGHTAVVGAAVWVKNGLYGDPVAITADRWLRIVDAPVLWVIDRALQAFSLPAEWFYPNLALAMGVHEFFAYGIFGGALYACVAAGFGYARQRKRSAMA